MKHKILIVGSSGTVGLELARLLRDAGQDLRLMTSRKPSQKNQVQVDLASGEGVKDAFEGVDKAFLISPPGYADQHSILSPLIQESKRRGLKKVVLMTAFGANAVETSPFRRAEIELEKSGLDYTIIRPNWFMQNFNTFWRHGIVNEQKIFLPAGQARTSFLDARDIAAVAAKLLTDDLAESTAIDLTGPNALTHAEVADQLSKTIGKKIIYQDIQPEVLRQELVQAGLPTTYVDFLLMIFGFLKEGYNAAVNQNVEMILGRKPRSFGQYANDYKDQF